jgi:hypothetical protein
VGAGLELVAAVGLGDGVVVADGAVADGVGVPVGVAVALDGLGLGLWLGLWLAGAVECA